MSYRGIIMFALCAWTLSAILSTTAAGQCAALNEHTSKADALAFLRASLNLSLQQRDPECISIALQDLKHSPSFEATSLLVKYLDFERPLSEAEQKGFMIHGPITQSTTYPAIGTLMTFGKEAIPELLATVETSASATIEKNATHTIMLIFRNEPANGIEALKQELRDQDLRVQ